VTSLMRPFPNPSAFSVFSWRSWRFAFMLCACAKTPFRAAVQLYSESLLGTQHSVLGTFIQRHALLFPPCHVANDTAAAITEPVTALSGCEPVSRPPFVSFQRQPPVFPPASAAALPPPPTHAFHLQSDIFNLASSFRLTFNIQLLTHNKKAPTFSSRGFVFYC
jgi:hypothetical protein